MNASYHNTLNTLNAHNTATRDINEKIKQDQHIKQQPQLHHEIRDPHGILDIILESESSWSWSWNRSRL